MKNILLNIAWWLLTIVLAPYILLMTLLGVLFIWYDPMFNNISRVLDGIDNWRHKLFIGNGQSGVEECTH